jgi:hypothetical protein
MEKAEVKKHRGAGKPYEEIFVLFMPFMVKK